MTVVHTRRSKNAIDQDQKDPFINRDTSHYGQARVRGVGEKEGYPRTGTLKKT